MPATDISTPERAAAASARRTRSLVAAGIGLALAAMLAAILFFTSGGGGRAPESFVQAPGAGLPGLTPSTANLLSLSVLGGYHPATDFHLTDQNGNPVSLSRFRGKAVILSFNDDRCTDVCTLLAEDVVRADEDLGPAGRARVVFLSVNVNPFYPQVQYVRAWTEQNGLSALPNWYFATGPIPALEAIWKAYGVYVGLDQSNRTVTHGAVLEFIGPDGAVHAAADFGQNAVDVGPYSHGLGQVAIDLLPSTERVLVGGPQANPGSGTGPGLGQRAPGFRLPLLHGGEGSLSLSTLAGEPVVLNFWASTCQDCRAELGAFAQVAKEDQRIRIVGVDIADPSPSSAVSLLQQAGVTYPVVIDRSGQVAASYEVKGLPTTFYIDRSGRVVVVHPGAMTAEQLRYTLAQFFPNDTPQGG